MCLVKLGQNYRVYMYVCKYVLSIALSWAMDLAHAWRTTIYLRHHTGHERDLII